MVLVRRSVSRRRRIVAPWSKDVFDYGTRPGGGIGRHAGLKILWQVIAVRVQLPSRVHLYIVYILYSPGWDRYYVGYSAEPERRLLEHNSGKVKSTRSFRPWTKVHQENFQTELQAIRRERQIKSMKSRLYIKSLIGKTRPD